METSLPVAERPRRPEWMKVRAPSADGRYFDVKKLIHGASLNTVCEEARCPNIAECWGKGTATFQILGDTCTRACRYCYVHSGRPEHAPDPLEPLRLAQAAAQMGLKHVVVTSVDRDDVEDRGAGHFAAMIRALKAKLPDCSVELLTPDFLGVEEQALATVLGARPEVFSHNIETVRRLHRRMRGAKASYDGALQLLRRAKEIADYPVLTKSGIIVGLGETNEEIVETMGDLRAHGVDVVTIGQYLQPSAQARRDRPLGASGRVPLAPRAGRGTRFRLGLRRPPRPLELPRRRAEARRRHGRRRRRLLSCADRSNHRRSAALSQIAGEPALRVRRVDPVGVVAPLHESFLPNELTATICPCPRGADGAPESPKQVPAVLLVVRGLDVPAVRDLVRRAPSPSESAAKRDFSSRIRGFTPWSP